MIGTHRPSRARPHGNPEHHDVPLLDTVALAEFEAEFFVEWQVADDQTMTPVSGPDR